MLWLVSPGRALQDALTAEFLVARRVDPICFAPRLAVTSVIAAVAIFIVKLGSFYVVPPGLEAANLIPYERLAEDLMRRGLGQARFVTPPRETRATSRSTCRTPAPCPLAQGSNRRPLIRCMTALACCSESRALCATGAAAGRAAGGHQISAAA
jgi:hypothetical protein